MGIAAFFINYGLVSAFTSFRTELFKVGKQKNGLIVMGRGGKRRNIGISKQIVCCYMKDRSNFQKGFEVWFSVAVDISTDS